jgi:hypothetical protein
MTKGITTLPTYKMFPAGVLLPSESEIYTAQLEANLSQGKKGRSNPEHTQQALFAEKLRRDNTKKPDFHPHPTAHRESISAHQDLRNLRSVTDKLQDVLKGISNAPQIQQTTIASIKDSMKANVMKDIFLKQRNKTLLKKNLALRTTVDNFQRMQREARNRAQVPDDQDQASLWAETAIDTASIATGRPQPKARNPDRGEAVIVARGQHRANREADAIGYRAPPSHRQLRSPSMRPPPRRRNSDWDDRRDHRRDDGGDRRR